MKLYYKLLDLIEGKYTTHETVEEVRHYITHRVSDMQYDYKVTDKLIPTPFPNYDFHYVIVKDDNEFREFVYFFDTIEEELDSRKDDEMREFVYFFDTIEEEFDLRKDDEMREQHDRAIKLLIENITALLNANRTIEFLRKRISDKECAMAKAILNSIYGMTATDDSEHSEIEYLKEVIKSKESRIDVLEAGLKESNSNTEYWKSRCMKAEELLQKIRDFAYPF